MLHCHNARLWTVLIWCFYSVSLVGSHGIGRHTKFPDLTTRIYLDLRIGRFFLSIQSKWNNATDRCQAVTNASNHNCTLLLGLCLTEHRSTNQRVDSKLESAQPADVQFRMINQYSVQLSHLPIKCNAGRDHFHTSLEWLNSTHITLRQDTMYRLNLATLPEFGILLTAAIYFREGTADKSDLHCLWKWEGRIPSLSSDNKWSTISIKSVSPSNPNGETFVLEPVNIQLEYKLSCRQNYYGPSCNHYCTPRHSILGHYQCHPQTGAFICQPGWAGTRCNQAICDQGCVHGICDQPGQCRCLDGWTGPKCDQCLPIPGCLHGRCHYNPTLGDWEPYTCNCNRGWIGLLCNINKNVCVSKESLCENGGKCISTPDVHGQRPLFTCQCPDGFAGTLCERRVHDCRYHGCGQMGACQDDGNCTCANGYYGSMCQFNQTSCLESPCQGLDSKCHVIMESERNLSTNRLPDSLLYKCECESGRYGLNCEYQVDWCASREPCFNSGRCVSESDGYRCICPPNFTGARCEQPRVACRNDSCANGGECLDRGSSFTCHCPLGWTGVTCHENVNECAEIPRLTGRALCEHGAGCRDLLGSYQCLCPTGWTGQHCELVDTQTSTTSVPADCSDQPGEQTEPSDPTLHGNSTAHSDSQQPIKHIVILFAVIGVAIPLTLITLVGSILLFITNYRSYRKDHRIQWPQNGRSRTNLRESLPQVPSKRYLTNRECQVQLISEGICDKPRLYSNFLTVSKPESLKLYKAAQRDLWDEKRMGYEKEMVTVIRKKQLNTHFPVSNRTRTGKQKSPNERTSPIQFTNNSSEIEPAQHSYNCIHATHSFHPTVVTQLPYIDQSLLNTFSLLSPTRTTNSPPPPYEEQAGEKIELPCVFHSTS